MANANSNSLSEEMKVEEILKEAWERIRDEYGVVISTVDFEWSTTLDDNSSFNWAEIRGLAKGASNEE